MEVFTGTWQHLLGRINGPLSFRIGLQPTVASILAIRAGLRGARAGQPPYFWSLFTDPVNRKERLRQGWNDISAVFLLAVLIDCVYQLLELHRLYPRQALLVAIVLAPLPYVVVRGLANRIARWRFHRAPAPRTNGDHSRASHI
jgi:hypothetical protein